MRTVGRNDACPCGSGRKHKRCCLDVDRAALRLAAELEARVLELGEEARDSAPGAWRAAFEAQIGPIGRFGTVVAAEAAWLDVWLVCHAPILDGRPPVDATTMPATLDETLRRSTICGWWVQGDGIPLDATHWRSEERVRLHTRHPPFGELRQGALVVGRAAEARAGAMAVVGPPVVVAEEAVEDVLEVLDRAPDQALCAALRWPEEREHTADGDTVQHAFCVYEVADADAAIAALRATRDVEQSDVVCISEGDVAFNVHAPRFGSVAPPRSEPGVVWELCDEDRAERPVLGEVTVSREEGDISLSAPTPARLRRLRDALPAAVTHEMGPLRSQSVDVPDVLPRVRRERLAALV